MTAVDPRSPQREARGNETSATLAALDWNEITCQSPAGCTSRATHIVHRHAVDGCNRPNVDPFGNIIDILCIGCVHVLKTEILRHIDRISSHRSDVYCLTCGTPVHKLSYVIRKVGRLPQLRVINTAPVSEPNS
jgi:hypothetical protein